MAGVWPDRVVMSTVLKGEVLPPYLTALAHHRVLRQSLLAVMADCGLQAGFKLRFAITKPGAQVLHTSGYATHRQAAGSLVHATIARALREMIAPTDPRRGQQESIPPGTVLEIWDEVTRQADVSIDKMLALPAHEDAFARRTLDKWAKDTRITISEVYGIEKRLSAPVYYPDGHGGMVERILTGQLDLLLVDPSGTHATVPDWKHSWRLPTRRGVEYDDDTFDPERDSDDDQLSAEGVFQQQFYAFLIFSHPDMRGIQSVTLRENYLPRSRERQATLWRHELPRLVSYFTNLAERFDRCYEASIVTRRGRIRRRVLATPAQWGEPAPGAACAFCPGAMDCPLPKEARESGMISSPEEAQTYAGILLRARRIVAMADKGLRTWTDREGPIRVRDGKRERYFGWLERGRVERPTLKQVDEAILAGRDPRDLYRRKVSTTFKDFSPEDQPPEIHPDDIAALWEWAAGEAARKRGRRAA